MLCFSFSVFNGKASLRITKLRFDWYLHKKQTKLPEKRNFHSHRDYISNCSAEKRIADALKPSLFSLKKKKKIWIFTMLNVGYNY